MLINVARVGEGAIAFFFSIYLFGILIVKEGIATKSRIQPPPCYIYVCLYFYVFWGGALANGPNGLFLGWPMGHLALGPRQKWLALGQLGGWPVVGPWPVALGVPWP